VVQGAVTDSDRPTTRPKYKEVLKWGDVLKGVVTIGSAVGVIWAFVYSAYSGMSTDQELIEHNLSDRAHPRLLEQQEAQRLQCADLTKKLEEIRSTVYILVKNDVRLRASERESDPRLRKAAADFYEEEFENLVRHGELLQDAFYESLRTPWHDRPRMR
jgi:hypothetical protein